MLSIIYIQKDSPEITRFATASYAELLEGKCLTYRAEGKQYHNVGKVIYLAVQGIVYVGEGP